MRWVEVDARLNADGVLVARHDPITEDGRFVSELSTPETDEIGLMRVADLLEDLPPEVSVDIDVKTSLEDALRPPAQTTAVVVARLVGAERKRRAILVSSFDPAAIVVFREHEPRVPVGLLTWTRFPLRKAIAAAAQLGLDVVAPHCASFTLRGERPPAESVRVAHEAGLEVLAWDVTAGDRDLLVAAGVDCLVVDDALPGTTVDN